MIHVVQGQKIVLLVPKTSFSNLVLMVQKSLGYKLPCPPELLFKHPQVYDGMKHIRDELEFQGALSMTAGTDLVLELPIQGTMAAARPEQRDSAETPSAGSKPTTPDKNRPPNALLDMEQTNEFLSRIGSILLVPLAILMLVSHCWYTSSLDDPRSTCHWLHFGVLCFSSLMMLIGYLGHQDSQDSISDITELFAGADEGRRRIFISMKNGLRQVLRSNTLVLALSTIAFFSDLIPKVIPFFANWNVFTMILVTSLGLIFLGSFGLYQTFLGKPLRKQVRTLCLCSTSPPPVFGNGLALGTGKTPLSEVESF